MSAAELTKVRIGNEIDAGALSAYLEAHLDGYAGPLSIQQFAGGQSNPTFLLETPGRNYVLRKKPGGTLLPGAHAIEREFYILAALGNTDVPVPEALLLCEDPAILGTPFYLMEHVVGRVARHASLPDSDPADRTAIYDAMNATAAVLHGIDWSAAGLSGFGKHGDYIARQIRLWSRQYEASKTHDIPEMDRLIAWLPENIPTGDETTIAHGDFRLENLVLHPTDNRVIAILDWELATLGHPLSDIAFNCMVYHVAPDFPGLRGIAGLDLTALGIPSEQEYLAAYCRRTGRERIDAWDFYLAFAMFRSAAILQGVYARALQNNAANPDALTVGQAAGPLARIAWRQVEPRTRG
ncbi:phosphotransferase [Sphingomonas sp.]|uniref:phosphotransferase n=1 Tax=Sphingomonas sp. TaxID=28214 RepID=UPI003D6D3B8E